MLNIYKTIIILITLTTTNNSYNAFNHGYSFRKKKKSFNEIFSIQILYEMSNVYTAYKATKSKAQRPSE